MDDCGSLRENGLKYIPRHDNHLEIDFGAKKDQCGFAHATTARLLCPRHLRDSFDEDPEAFCAKVHNGDVEIMHDDWPTFLYLEDGYDPDVIDHTLLQGPFLLAVSPWSLSEQILTIHTVLLTHIYRSAYCFEDHTRKAARQKDCCGIIWHQAHSQNYCICRSNGASYTLS
jgi:hypothetical protein